MRYTTRIIVPPRVRRSGQPGGGGAYRPQVLGVRKSFAFDDPFGLATPGHLGAAILHPEIAPVFVQHSFAGGESATRSPGEAMATAMRSVGQARFRLPWGADANLLRSPQDVEAAAAAGFTYYTIDPSEYLRQGVDSLAQADIDSALATLIEEGTLTEDWCEPYLDRTIDLPGNQRLVLGLEPLQRAAISYARAIRHCARLSESVARANQGRPYETEAFFGAVSRPATPLEHLFIGLELESRGTRLTSLGLKLVGLDDAARVQTAGAGGLEARLREHAAVAEFCGPYKLSFHDVSLLPSLYPALGRYFGDAFHIKNHHLSFLEAMRVLHRAEPVLFTAIARAVAIVIDDQSPESAESFAHTVTRDMESDWLNGVQPDSFLKKSTAVVMTALDEQGRPLRLTIADTLERHADIYREQLTALFDKRLFLLKSG